MPSQELGCSGYAVKHTKRLVPRTGEPFALGAEDLSTFVQGANHAGELAGGTQRGSKQTRLACLGV